MPTKAGSLYIAHSVTLRRSTVNFPDAYTGAHYISMVWMVLFSVCLERVRVCVCGGGGGSL